MNNSELSILLLLAKSTLKEKKDGLISAEEANKTFLEIKEKMNQIDSEISKSFLDKLVTRIEF